VTSDGGAAIEVEPGCTGKWPSRYITLAGVIEVSEQCQIPLLPCDGTPFPVTRCQVCHRTVAWRVGILREVLIERYRWVCPEALSLPSGRSRSPRQMPLQGRPAARTWARGYGRRTPALPKRGRALVRATHVFVGRTRFQSTQAEGGAYLCITGGRCYLRIVKTGMRRPVASPRSPGICGKRVSPRSYQENSKS
jgi:hypothetical protein